MVYVVLFGLMIALAMGLTIVGLVAGAGTREQAPTHRPLGRRRHRKAMARVEADSRAQELQMQADLEAQKAQQAAAWAELRRHLETTVAPDEHERQRQQDEIDEFPGRRLADPRQD